MANFGALPGETTATTDAGQSGDRLKALILLLEGRLRRVLTAIYARLRSPALMETISSLLAAGDIAGAFKVIETAYQPFASALSHAFISAGKAEADMGARFPSTVGVSFDPGNPRAAELMAQNTLERFELATEAQKEAVREALVQSMQTGQNPRAAARAFRDAIGLTEKQIAQVANYRRLLESQSRDALARVLRDRRFDRTVQRAIDTNEPLSAAQVDRMVERYEARARDARAETIARTETVRIVSAARQEAVQQSMDAANLTDGQVVRRWRAIEDTRTRHTHRALDGQEVVGMQTPFRSPSGALLRYPGDPSAPADEVINCRCALTYRFLTNQLR